MELPLKAPTGKRDRERLDQKPHADGRAAGDDGEADAGIAAAAAPRPCVPSVRILSLGEQGAVDIGNDEGDAGHCRLCHAFN